MIKEKGFFEKELFKRALKNEPEFSKYQLESLESLGNFLARNDAIFKRVYNAYRNKEASVEIKLTIGAPLNVSFNWKQQEVSMSRSGMGEVKFTVDAFLHILGLVDQILYDVIPVGSIVEIDLDFLPESMSSIMSEARAIIVNQKAMLHQEVDSLYIDYVANLWPHANQGNIPPLFLSNVMIKNVIHKGHTNDEEQEYIMSLKEAIVNAHQKSITFMSEKELEKLEEMMIERAGEDSV